MKTQNKVHWSKNDFWELDYLALDENLWDDAGNYLLWKFWQEVWEDIKDRIEKALHPNNKKWIILN